MEEAKKAKIAEIDFWKLLQIVLKRRKRFGINITITIVVSVAIVLCLPRYYTCDVKLAPETNSLDMGSGLSSLASSFGLNMSNMMSQDAISPELYPDLMESVDFRTSMFPVKVKTLKGEISTTYYEYIQKHQRFPFWTTATMKMVQMFKEKPKDTPISKINPFMMTKPQSDVAKIIGGKIKCSVDKKTDVITISVEDQDALVCATIADSARSKLQAAITKYRTNKARIDLDYAKKLNNEAKMQYDKARQVYASYSDANQDIILESYKAKVNDLENEMQLKYNIYQQTSQQVQLALAKLQERTPAFTILQSATVPLKPAGPKRMIIVGFCTIVTFLCTLLYCYRKEQNVKE